MKLYVQAKTYMTYQKTIQLLHISEGYKNLKEIAFERRDLQLVDTTNQLYTPEVILPNVN